MRSLIPLLALTSALTLEAASTPTAKPVFHKDVAPILQSRCQSCHRPGEVAPMSFLTYRETRPWAKAIRGAVLAKKMPPWFADPKYGHFANDRRLSESEIQTLVSWADAGAAEGNPADTPKPLAFVDGWNIGKPDLIIEMPKDFEIPASGTVNYQHIIVPTGLTEDRWVEAAEIRPGNRSVVHHVIAFTRPPSAKALRTAKMGDFLDSGGGKKLPKPGEPEPLMFSSGVDIEALQTFAPGVLPTLLKPGQARLIKAGSDIIFQLHYTSTGKPATDRTRLGIVFSKTPPTERVRHVNVQNFAFSIPPRVDNYPIEARARLIQEVKLVSLHPHMHFRGKDFTFRATYPTGESEILLSVPRWDFNWQLTYYLEKPKVLPKGTIIEIVGHYDNTANNPANPDPNALVLYGEQTWNEMLGGVMDIAHEPGRGSVELFETVAAPQKTGAAGSN